MVYTCIMVYMVSYINIYIYTYYIYYIYIYIYICQYNVSIYILENHRLLVCERVCVWVCA